MASVSKNDLATNELSPMARELNTNESGAPLPAGKPKTGVRLGICDGMYRSMTLEEFNASDEEIAKLFLEGDIFPSEPEAGGKAP